MGIAVWLGLVGGLAVLTAGAEALVRGSSALAMRLGVSALVIGLTVVAFGTSSPEMAVSVRASLAGDGPLALGNVIGSNISNVLLILGLSAMIRPVAIQANVIRRETPIMIGVSLLLWWFLYDGSLSRVEGGLLVAGLVAYIVGAYMMAKRESNPAVDAEFEESLQKAPKSLLVSGVLVLVGLAGLIAGAVWFVDSAVAIAEHFGLSRAVIGLTIVAVGTSLPELATSVAASFKNEGDIVIGNVLGSNVFNILGILGVAAIAAPISTEGFNSVDVLVMIAASVILLPLMRTGWKLDRWEGGLLVASYVGYLAFLGYDTGVF